MSKRAAILALFHNQAFPIRIITEATSPPADPDYQRRLRHWAADCATRSLHLIADDKPAMLVALGNIQTARTLADVATLPTTATYAYPEFASLYEDARRTTFAPQAEARLAAALAGHHNVFLGALGSSSHARRAIQNVNVASYPRDHIAEMDWQVDRLKAWLADDEPTPLELLC